MAELDFDELDKAVNDLMVNVDTGKRTAGLDDPKDNVISIPSSTDADKLIVPPASPVDDPQAPPEDSPQDNATAPPSTLAAPALAVKRRGQFMDIVHPSLNMTSSPKFANRHGTTLQPSNSAESLAPEEPKDHDDEIPQPTPAERPETEPAAQSEWPDPIDMADKSAAAEQKVGIGATLTDTLSTPAVESTQAESTEPAPLSSPFLSDTKVEKRPLGSPISSVEPKTQAEAKLAEVGADPQVPAAEIAPIVLPEEFSGDVMAVEAKDLSSHPDVAKAQITPVVQPSAESSMTVPNGSISQQYTEKPSSGDQTSGSIYDTSTYHQAIDAEKSVKKPALLKWIIWIVVLLLVGAAGGAAYFYFTR